MIDDKNVGEEYLVGKNDEQKVYVLSDTESVDQLIHNLSSGAKGGISQQRLQHKLNSGRGEQQQDDMLTEMNTRLQALLGNNSDKKLLTDENLAFDNGEQKVYILPDMTAVEQLRRGLNRKSGECSKSRMWDKTTLAADEGQSAATELAGRLQILEAKLQRLESVISTSNILNKNEGK